MCRMLGFVSREPIPIRRYLVDAPHGLLAMSRRGQKAPHRDGFGWAYLDGRGRMRLYRWGRAVLARVGDGVPSDLDAATTLLLAHARKASPEYGALTGGAHAHPMVHDGVFLAHNGTVRDAEVLDRGSGTDSQKLVRWLARAWQPRTLQGLTGALRELLGMIRDYTALNLLLTDGSSLYAFCLYTRDPDYYTLHHRMDEGAVVVASEPLDAGPGWRPVPSGELLCIESGLTLTRTRLTG
ncbi:MAG: class II glutamine amidotransferase [Candidatus Acetothermia bacterium]|jgi:glutamine amidotransferase|nr:class II glutamine amidotransferase [Candidatus Acetothermia bacterium]